MASSYWWNIYGIHYKLWLFTKSPADTGAIIGGVVAAVIVLIVAVVVIVVIIIVCVRGQRSTPDK